VAVADAAVARFAGLRRVVLHRLACSSILVETPREGSPIEFVRLAEVSPYPFASFRISIAAVRVASMLKSAKSALPGRSRDNAFSADL
jgi:hypothetical protein